MSLPVLDNGAARRLFLDRHALAEPPTGPARGADLLALIRRLGFVQVDSINTVARAHHMILWSRRQTYRESSLKRLLETDRLLFEHWTHDAAIIPVEFMPHWRLRFERDAARIRESWAEWQGDAFHGRIDEVIDRIRRNGPVGAGEVREDEGRSRGGWWEWHPSKTALEYLWRCGVLSVCHRRGFAKYYDLTERVFPALAPAPPAEETIDWACGAALDRLGFATSGEIAAFWRKVTPEEAKAWCARGLRSGALVEILVEGADGARRRCLARPDVAEAAGAAPEPPRRVRILSPFDPALRDRARAERLFGFRYRIEIFVPEAKRVWGYYVFPVMEGDRIIGRLDAKCLRAEGVLAVRAFWPEPGVAMGGGRTDRLMAELGRLGRFAGCPELRLAADWLRRPAQPAA
ncbi:MAG: winged helix DNA-binding domain-containing protein [Rhodobacteraceae bacterium]|nr:winged helix DNA-binding domain-containing protein [Paracoccaceae bacterium]